MQKHNMKVIALEEHFSAARVPDIELPKSKEAFFSNTCVGAPFHNDKSLLGEIGEKRLQYMSDMGVDVQVLSTTTGQALNSDVAVDYCKKINNYLYEQIKDNPEHFLGYASIPTAVPQACADELERCVKELGFVGCMVGARTEDEGYLAREEYEPFFAKAEELDVPIYIHPGVPPEAVSEACYKRYLSPKVGTALSMYGFGWHVDPGTHMLNLVLSGVFDRHPNLKIIMGHWGELLPYFLDRFDDALPAEFTGLQHEPSYYLRNNLYVTPSGIYTPELLEYNLKMLGADHILFSADYPWTSTKGIAEFFANPVLSEEDREKIAYKNAEKLFHL